MIRQSPRYLLAALAFVLALTSWQVAVARAQSDPAGNMVICAGQGVITVYVDDEGNPVGAPHICPDTVLTLFVSDGIAPPDMAVALKWVRLPRDFAVRAAVHQSGIAPSARGPPVAV